MQHVERKMLDGKSEILYENILLDWVFSFWCPGHKNFTETYQQFSNIKTKEILTIFCATQKIAKIGIK